MVTLYGQVRRLLLVILLFSFLQTSVSAQTPVGPNISLNAELRENPDSIPEQEPVPEDGTRKKIWTLQAGSFKNPESAKKTLEQISLSDGRIENIQGWYTLRYGAFETKEQAQEFRKGHQEKGLEESLIIKTSLLPELLVFAGNRETGAPEAEEETLHEELPDSQVSGFDETGREGPEQTAPRQALPSDPESTPQTGQKEAGTSGTQSITGNGEAIEVPNEGTPQEAGSQSPLEESPSGEEAIAVYSETSGETVMPPGSPGTTKEGVTPEFTDTETAGQESERKWYSLDEKTLRSFFILFLIFLLIDGIKIILEISHRSEKRSFSSDPDQVTALIACHNSADVIGFTLEDLLQTFSPENIIVVDDASTDRTAEIAGRFGVQVHTLERNMGKVSAINYGIFRVKTKYTFLLDDDTRIGDSALPTSLLEEGYSAVAFNVLPCRRTREISNGTNFVSCLQRYEYSKSMEIGKRFQDATLSVSCISGAAGLFKTERLNAFHHLHSTVFQGEDLERTLIDLLQGGQVVFVDENVWTISPDNLWDLTRQRIFKWFPGFYRNILYFWKVLFNRESPCRLKLEMLYNLYIILSDPIKVYSFIILVWYGKWEYLFFLYFFYLLLEVYPFIVVEKKLPMMRYYFPALILFPIYGIYNMFLRFISLFVWAWQRFVTKKMKPKGKPEDRMVT